MDADQVLAFRLARSGLAVRSRRGLADAAACPVSDFARDAALLALAARADGVSREAYCRAVGTGELVVARDDDELAAQLGRQVRGLPVAPGAALDEVAAATGGVGERPGAGQGRAARGAEKPAPPVSEAVRRFLRFYGPAKPGDFADWAGVAKPHAPLGRGGRRPQRSWGG